MNKLILGVVIVLAMFGMIFLVTRPVSAPEPEAAVEEEQVATQELQIEISDTAEERERGLSGRVSIPDNYGMLFIFDRADRYGFWMKDMYASIDIIWLRDDGTIVGIEDSVSPTTYPDSFYPSEPVRYVLETRAGYARDHEWVIGTVVPIELP